MFDINNIQRFFRDEKLDGWLLADFHGRNSIAVEFLELPEHITRRFAFFIPSEGAPTAFIHNIEKDRFRHLPGDKIFFSSYKALEETLKAVLRGRRRVAMEYSPSGRLPYIGLVDAGTIELVKSFGIEVVSSADLVAYFQARMTEKQEETHRIAARMINSIKDEAFRFIHEKLKEGSNINEKAVVAFILRRFQEERLVTDFPPIVAVNANISNPHYSPPEHGSSPINKNDLFIIDLWAKGNEPHAVFADITWAGYAGETAPEKYQKVFDIVRTARDRAVAFIGERFPRETVYGYQVDDACRQVISEAGFGEHFFHRTGHSILEEVHGPGPNIDNLETEDRRKLLPGHLFSIEPGIYLPEFGVRSEIDVMITAHGPEITTQPVQQHIIPLFG